MAVSRVKVWTSGEVLTASDLNTEFNNILNNGEALGEPRTSAFDMDGFELIMDGDGDSSIHASTDDQFDFRLGAADRFVMTTTAFDMNALKLILDTDADTSIQADTDDQIDFETGGADRMSIANALVTINVDTTVNGTLTATSIVGSVATGEDIDMDGNSLILDGDGDTSITADTDDQIDIEIGGFDDFQFIANSFVVLTGSNIDMNAGTLILDADGDTHITASTDDQINFATMGVDRVFITNTALDINGLSLILDADADTSITADTDDQIDFAVAGVDEMSLTSAQLTINTDTVINGSLTATSITGGFEASGAIDMDGEQLTLDADGDTSIHASTDDQIDIEIAGADDFRFVANSFLVLSGSNIDMSGQTIILDDDADTSITADTDDQIDLACGGIDRASLTNTSLSMAVDVDLNGNALVLDSDADSRLFASADDAIQLSTLGTNRMTWTTTSILSGLPLDIQGNELILDADNDTSITADSDDQIDFKVGNTDVAEFTTSFFRLNTIALNMEGNEIVLDVDADTSITASTDDQIDFETSGVDRMSLTTAALDMSVDVDLNGNSLLLDADGNTSIDASTNNVIDINVAGATDFRFQANSLQMMSGSSMSFNNSGDNIFLNGASLRLDSDDDTRIFAGGDDQIDFAIGGSTILSLTDDPKFSFHKQNNVREFAANHTLQASDNGRTLVFNTSATDRTLNLLAVATAGDGFWVHVKKESSSNTLILSTNSTETIDGNDGLTLESGNQAVTLVCDGAEWHVVNISSPIIQHVTAATSTQASTASGTYQSSNLSASITPRKSGKVMAMASSSATVENTSGNTASMASRLQNTTTATTHEGHLIAVGTGNATTNLIAGVVNLYGWETGLTVGTSYTFEVQFRLNTGTTAFIHTANAARIFLMEVDV